MLKSPPFWRGQLFALAGALFALLVRASLGPLLHHGFPFICFVPCILVVALAAGASAGVGALVYSAALVVGVYIAVASSAASPR